MYLFSLILTSFVLSRVLGTLIPSGSVSIDCGGQRTFTCTVTGQAQWTVTGLMGITAAGSTAGSVAVSARVTTTDTGLGPTSTITITGFTTSDNGGTVQCLDVGGGVPSVEGVATVAVVSTTLENATAVDATVDQCSANLTWIEPSNSSATTSVSCTPPSPQCSSCTSSGCTIGGLNSSTSYTFSVTRSRSGCDDSIGVSDETTTESVPSCPTNVSVTDRSGDFSSATITWDQPANSPPVTSYDVTCNSSCTAMPCTSGSSTCRVLSVSPCEDYSVTVLTMNSCGSSTGCTGNVVSVPSQGPPQCGTVGVDYGNDSCPSFTFTPQGNVLPSTVVVSYQLVADTSSAGSLNCAYPIDPRACRLVVPGGTYTVRATPQNSCGAPISTCSSRTEIIPAGCEPVITSPSVSSGPIVGGVIGGVAAVVIVGVLGWCITILIMSCTCFAYLGFLALLKCLCCSCCKGKTMKSSSKQRIGSESPVTPPAQLPVQPPAQPPADEYADPQAIRDRKERGEEDKDMIQYAAIDFSAGAGSGAGEVKIHQKEEPVIYTTVQHV